MSSHLTFEQMKKQYLKVFLSLIVLTVLTVAITTIHFGDTMNIVVGVIIAALKAGLVIAIFMHLKFDNKKVRYAVIVPMFFFVVLVFTLTILGL